MSDSKEQPTRPLTSNETQTEKPDGIKEPVLNNPIDEEKEIKAQQWLDQHRPTKF